MIRNLLHSLPILATLLVLPLAPVSALDGGTLRVRLDPTNGWRGFEVITTGDNPSDDGFDYSLPGIFDGAGAWLVDASTLRVQTNHEVADASISEVNIDLANLRAAIQNTIDTGNTGGVGFVVSARQAYDRVSDDRGSTWTDTSNTSNTNFFRFCSGQAYAADTFGPDRGFVDPLYITGEEGGDGRLFVLDSVERDFYQLSGRVGAASGGNGGIREDNWENAALVDTGETGFIALMLSPDGGTQRMQLYIGHKGLGFDGNPSSTILARNGLEYGSYYYLRGSLPDGVGSKVNGDFSRSTDGALSSSKLEDIDTSPSDPTRVVLGDQNSGLHTFDFNLTFDASGLVLGSSSFNVTCIESATGGSGMVSNPDNVEWTDATILGDTSYPDGLIFVNEDNSSGEIWMVTPEGIGDTRIGDTNERTESSGIFDISDFVGYRPGSILITNNQGSTSSMTVLINPNAAAAAICGDLNCGDGENATTCATDCPATCGDGASTHSETCDDEAESCTNHGGYAGDDTVYNDSCDGWNTSACRSCGDGTCDSGDGETSVTCLSDCPDDSCGDGLCNGVETALSCPSDCRPSVCGDGTCDAGTEDETICSADCSTSNPDPMPESASGCHIAAPLRGGRSGLPLSGLLFVMVVLFAARRQRLR